MTERPDYTLIAIGMCPREQCDGVMRLGQAVPTEGQEVRVCFHSPKHDATELIPVAKCSTCGHSVSLDHPVRTLEEEVHNARVAVRGHTSECCATKPFFGTASEDPGCDCGFQAATDAGLGREVYDAIHKGPIEEPTT